MGSPCSVHTDQGRNLDSNLFRDVCSLLGVQKTRTAAFHPAGDGLVERLNQTIEKLLSHYVSSRHDDWDTHLPTVLMAYRFAVQPSTTYTQHYLMFGRDMRLPTDVVYGLPVDHPAASSPPASVWRLRERLADAHALVRKKLPAVHRHQKANFDHHAVSVSFTKGDLVWLLTLSVGVGLSSKFNSPWRGPYEVVDCLANGVNYRLRTTWAPHRLVVAHVNRMKPCHRCPADLTTIPEVPRAPPAAQPTLSQPSR